MVLVTIVCSLTLVALANGHGAIVTPRGRNSVDYLPDATPQGPINSPKDWPDNWECTNITGDGCHNGQADFWYSQVRVLITSQAH